MKKALISVDNVAEYVCRLENRIFVDGAGMILTPGAKDELSKKGVRIIYGPCPDAAGCQAHQNTGSDGQDEALLFGVAAVLQSEYGISDLETLKSLSLKAARIIKENM